MAKITNDNLQKIYVTNDNLRWRWSKNRGDIIKCIGNDNSLILSNFSYNKSNQNTDPGDNINAGKGHEKKTSIKIK